MPISAERRHLLMGDADRLSRQLGNAPVRRANARPGESPESGIPKNALSRVSAYLADCRDAAAFQRFLTLLPDVDRYEAQNSGAPKLVYAALANELRGIRSPKDLDEWRFLLAWTQRLMVDQRSGGGGGGRDGDERRRR